MLRFALTAYRDARLDPFFPASPLVAAWFVVRHWRWLHSEGGPYSPELHGTETRMPG